jgi:hypothetical protein
LIDGGRGPASSGCGRIEGSLNWIFLWFQLPKRKNLFPKVEQNTPLNVCIYLDKKTRSFLFLLHLFCICFNVFEMKPIDFGIENHRRRRSKETIHSFLKQISGVGPKKQRLLLTAFDSIETLQRATLEEIQSVSGIDQKTAQSIFSFFRAMTPSNEEE